MSERITETETIVETTGIPEDDSFENPLRKNYNDPKSRKMLLFFGGSVIVLIIAAFYFSHPKVEKGNKSVVLNAPQSSSGYVGKYKVNKKEQSLFQQKNEQSFNEAQKSGKTSIPELVNLNNQSVAPPNFSQSTSLPNTMVKPTFNSGTTVMTPKVSVPVDKNRLSVMEKELSVLSNTQQISPPEVMAFNDTNTKGAADSIGSSPTSNVVNSNALTSLKHLNSSSTSKPNAGPYKSPQPTTILFSHTISGINSDTPGPVLAEIDQGPFRNARLQGEFKKNKYGGVVIKFTLMSKTYYKNGKEHVQVIPINAIALNQSSLGNNLETSVNYHFIQNLGAAFVGSFMQGLSTAEQEAGSTTNVSPLGTVTSSNPGLSLGNELTIAGGSAFGTAGQIFENIYGNRPVTIKVSSGTPFALYFLGGSN